jgi:N2-(2-carboxyethyl)arginine synthase
MKLSQYLLSELGQRGIHRVFGVPGRENAHILFNEFPSIEFVTARVEFNAGIMAEFTGRMTQRPQAVFCTMGPGATNMVTAASSAMLNRSPLLIVSAQLETDDRYYNLTHQCVDQRAVFEPVTKWSHELDDADELPAVLEKAFEIMMTEPVGPVHLSIPTNLFSKSINAARIPLRPAVRPQVVWPSFAANPAGLREIHALLAQSSRPLCLVGHEAVRAQAHKAVKSLCEAWNMPLLAAANAKGMMAVDHPLNVGSASCYMEGILQHPTALAELFDDVDLIINIGYQYVDDILPKMWNRGKPKKVVHLSAFASDPIASKYAPDLTVLGRVDQTVPELLTLGATPRKGISLNGLRDHYLTVYEASTSGGVMGPVSAIRAINDFLGDGTFVTDIGYYRHHAILFGRQSRVGQFFTDSGLSTFGCGLPSAAAAQFLDRDKPVFLLCGDGGFHSGSCDLETLVRHQLPVVIIVLNNSQFELIHRYQKRGGNGHNPEILSFSPIDFAQLAQANGVTGIKITSEAHLRHCIAERDRTKPLLLDVPFAYDVADKFIESF